MIYVPLYDTLGEPAIVHIINQSMRSDDALASVLFDSIFVSSLAENRVRGQTGKCPSLGEDGQASADIETHCLDEETP